MKFICSAEILSEACMNVQRATACTLTNTSPWWRSGVVKSIISDEFDNNCYSPTCMNEKELEQLGSLRSKADAIQAKLTKSISVKRDENPAYYDSFSKRIKDALQEYKDRIITDAEYLAKMRSIKS